MDASSRVPPTWGAQLAHAASILASAGSPAPGEEAIELLGSLLDVPAALLLARPASLMDPSEVEAYAGWVTRRARGEAMPHITGHLAFMGLDLVVRQADPLVPAGARRLVETALQWARHRAPGELLAADVGTGCGAVALALAALEPRLARVYALDPSPEALETAAANGARYLLNLVVNWLVGDGPDAIPEPVDLIVCGQPGDASSPRFARLLERAPAKLRPGGALMCGPDGAPGPALAEALARAFLAGQAWVDAQSGVAIAQVPRPSPGDAALKGGG